MYNTSRIFSFLPIMRRLKVFIACSLDGYIADENESLEFLNCVHDEDEDYGYSSFYDKVQTVLIGRKTYDTLISFGMPFAHEGKETFVFTRKFREENRHAKFITDNPVEFVKILKNTPGGLIYCDGGGTIVTQLITAKLVDEIVVSIIPRLLGKGTKLFNENLMGQIPLYLVSSRSFPSGLVQIKYRSSPIVAP